MDVQFFSKENFLVLQNIVSSLTDIDYNTHDNKKNLYETMVETFTNNNDVSDFHILNKQVIDTLKQTFNVFERKNEEYDMVNEEDNDEDTYEDQGNINELFSTITNDRNYNISNNQNENLKKNSIQSDIEEMMKKGNDLNDFNLVNDNIIQPYDMDNIMDENIIDTNNFSNEDDFKGKDLSNDNKIRDRISTFENTSGFPHPPLSIPTKEKQIEKDIIIVIDSRDRDLSVYPHPNHFQVKFGGNSDTIEIPTHLNNDGTISHEAATLFKGYGGASINNIMKNIKEIQLINVIVPYAPVYYNGKCPTKFNNNNQTQNGTTDWVGTKGLLSQAYEPLYDTSGPSGTGIPIDVLSEPYLLIDIDEINTQHYFRSTNLENERAFARVINDKLFGSALRSSYIVYRTYSPDEKMTFYPTLLSSLDKMTLHVRNQTNTHVNFGQDKTYIASFSEYTTTQIRNRCIGNTNTNGTKITITTQHNDYIQDDCPNDTILGHCLSPGDIIYLYDIRPCISEHVFKLNQNQVTGTYSSSSGNHLFEIKFKALPTKKGEKSVTRTLALSNYVLVGDYLSISGNLYKVKGFSGRKAILSEKDYNMNNLSGTYKDVGFVRQNKRGFIKDDTCSINYKGGYRVCYVLSETEFVIDYPYSSLTNYLKNSNYEVNSVFFIKKYMQINYMFKFTIVEKDYEQIKSDIL